MAAPAGWYEADIPGRQRWWDGATWSDFDREAPSVVPVKPLPAMGWYPVDGTNDIRWWDGAVWAPYRFRDGRAKTDITATEPPVLGGVLGGIFLFVGLVQLFAASFIGQAFALISPLLFSLAGGYMIFCAIYTRRVRSLPAPTQAPFFADDVRPIPGEVEGQGAGWYPVTRQIQRWWTGQRWAWYTATTLGVRPGFAGPKSYKFSIVMCWFLVGLALAFFVLCLVWGLTMPRGAGTSITILGAFLGITIGAIGGLCFWLTHARRYAMILPPTAPQMMPQA